MTLTIIIAIVAFLVITLALVGLLLFAKAKLTTSGDVTIDINGGEKVLIAESGGTLLSTVFHSCCISLLLSFLLLISLFHLAISIHC